jgi:Predicted membrane protein (DUF2339)
MRKSTMHEEHVEPPFPLRNAERPPSSAEVEKLEPKVLGVAGIGLLGLALFFGWKELQVQPEALLLVGTAAAAVAAAALKHFKIPSLGPVLLIASTAIGALWYGATREPMLLWGLGAAFAASTLYAVMGLKGRAALSTPSLRLHHLLSWHGVALSGLAASFAVYFQVFDAQANPWQDFVARRALFSLLWLLSGVGLVVWGRAQKATEVRDAGFVVLAAGVVKLVTYDSTHLDGVLRVGALAVAGSVLMAAAGLLRRLKPEAR